MKNNKSINDITLFRYLFNLDNRDLPQSVLNWYSKVGSVVDSDRENAIRELSKIKGNCRNLVIFSKIFIDTMDKSYMKFTQFHMDILNELDNENGIVRSPYFIDGCYVVYSIKKRMSNISYGLHQKNLFAVSRFQNKVELNFIDLLLPAKEKLKLSIYQELVPLIISCMIPVVNDSDTFKPEYIISQLIFEWFLKNREFNGKMIHGIAYTSTHLNDEFYFPNDKFINYAIPVFDVNEKHKYCKEFCSIFRLTKPTTNDIEKFKWAYPVEVWNYPEDEKHKRIFNYDILDFGNLEGRLEDTDNFPLQTTAYK